MDLSEIEYEKKYNKYKIKYLALKKKLEKKNEKILMQKGGVLGIFEKLGLSCNNYYNQTNIYSFENFDELKKFLIEFSGYNDNWNNGTNTHSNYSNTILDELIKINFDVVNRFNELPELVKLLLHLRPKPAHILEFLFDKNLALDIKDVLSNTYVSKSNLSFTQIIDFRNIPRESIYDATMVILNGFLHGTKLYGYEITRGGINKEVLSSIRQIMAIEPENPSTNTWNSITKLLEFIGCMADSQLFDYSGIKLENYTGFLKEQIVQMVFFDDIIRNKEKRKFSNFYSSNQNSSQSIPNYYDKFVLMDFFNPAKNTNFIIPPSVLLFLSVKLNPILNNSSYWVNNYLRSFIEYITNKGCNYQEEEVINKIEEYVEQNPPKELNITQTDSNLIDVALIGLTNGTDKELKNNNITSSNTLLTEAGIKYTQIMSSITDKIKSNIRAGLTTFTTNMNILKSINIFKPTNLLTRKEELQNRIKQLETKLEKLNQDFKTADSSKKFLGWFSSEKEKIKDKIDRNELKINDAKLELIELDKIINNKDGERTNKLNYILSTIILMAGIGINRISKDLCTVDKNSTISWRTFDKLLSILDGKLFTIINLSSSNSIKHLTIQYIVPYSTYLHLDLNRFFHLKFKLNQQKALEFDNWYNEYEKRIYENFINHTDGFYYEETDANGKEIKNIYALFPPAKLLNEIKDSIEAKKK